MFKRLYLIVLCLMMLMLFAACSAKDKGDTQDGGQVADVAVDNILKEIKEAYGEGYLPSMPVDALSLSEQYGVSADLYDEAAGEVPMISAQIDTILIIKAKDGQVKAIETALNDYRSNQIENSLQYPSNIPKLEASQVYSVGDYVFFIMLGDIPLEIYDQGEDAALEEAQRQNKIAIEVIDRLLKQ